MWVTTVLKLVHLCGNVYKYVARVSVSGTLVKLASCSCCGSVACTQPFLCDSVCVLALKAVLAHSVPSCVVYFLSQI